MNIQNYWSAVLKQDKSLLKEFFDPSATICWHNTNEKFTVAEFLIANCEYPEKWAGEIKHITKMDDGIITTVHVFSTTKPLSFHVTSYIKLKNGKIITVDEYWGDDGPMPKWRLDKNIGRPIK